MSGCQICQHPQSRASTWSQYLQRRLQVVLVPLSEVLHRAGGIGSLHGRARLFQMLDVLDVRQFATTRVLLRLRPGEDDVRLELSHARTSDWVRRERVAEMKLTFMMSRMNDCVPFGKTGYPLALAMNVDAGSQRFRTGSACH